VEHPLLPGMHQRHPLLPGMHLHVKHLPGPFPTRIPSSHHKRQGFLQNTRRDFLQCIWEVRGRRTLIRHPPGILHPPLPGIPAPFPRLWV
jgi:hypothetical protein